MRDRCPGRVVDGRADSLRGSGQLFGDRRGGRAHVRDRGRHHLGHRQPRLSRHAGTPGGLQPRRVRTLGPDHDRGGRAVLITLRLGRQRHLGRIREKYAPRAVQHQRNWSCTIEPSRTGTSLHSLSRGSPPRGEGDRRYPSSTLFLRKQSIFRSPYCHDPQSGVKAEARTSPARRLSRVSRSWRRRPETPDRRPGRPVLASST